MKKTILLLLLPVAAAIAQQKTAVDSAKIVVYCAKGFITIEALPVLCNGVPQRSLRSKHPSRFSVVSGKNVIETRIGKTSFFTDIEALPNKTYYYEGVLERAGFYKQRLRLIAVSESQFKDNEGRFKK